MVKKARSADERRAFAAEQFEKLIELGLPRKAANQVMEETGPSLAVKAVEWTQSIVPIMVENYKINDAIIDAHAQPGAELVESTTPGMVRDSIGRYLEELIEQFGSCDSALELAKKILHMSMVSEGEEGYFSHEPVPTLPSQLAKEIVRIAQAAQVALPYITFPSE